MQDAVIRRFEVIGEAARRISDEGQSAYAGLPWMEMIGMRNIMIHEYDNVDLHVVWNTVKNSLPGLIAAITAILETKNADEEK